jgi:hypothetical protein
VPSIRRLHANKHVTHKSAIAWLGHSSSDILDCDRQLHDNDSQQAMQALAMTKRGEGAASQEQLKAGNVRKARGAQSRISWVSFGSYAPPAPMPHRTPLKCQRLR